MTTTASLPSTCMRIRATDLRDAGRQAAAARAASGGIPVYLDIEVLIDRDVASAFSAVAGLPEPAPEAPKALRYIGTARGLAGLISDVQRLGIADAVVLLPLAECPVESLMLEELAPGLGGLRASRCA